MIVYLPSISEPQHGHHALSIVELPQFRDDLHRNYAFTLALAMDTEPLMIRCPFRYALADTEADPRCQALLVGSSPSRHPLTRLEAPAQLPQT